MSLQITQVKKFSQNWKAKKLKDVLLEPTRIYVKAALPLIKEELVNGIAHITGGGFIENVPRMFSDDLAAEIDESKYQFFQFSKPLKKYGQIKHEEMFEIFNMGIGLMLDETRKCGTC